MFINKQEYSRPINQGLRVSVYQYDSNISRVKGYLVRFDKLAIISEQINVLEKRLLQNIMHCESDQRIYVNNTKNTILRYRILKIEAEWIGNKSKLEKTYSMTAECNSFLGTLLARQNFLQYKDYGYDGTMEKET